MATRRAGLGRAQGAAAAAKAAAAVVVVEVGKALLLRRGRGEKPREERAAVVDFLRSARRREPNSQWQAASKNRQPGSRLDRLVAVWLVDVVGDMGGVNNGELRILCWMYLVRYLVCD